MKKSLFCILFTLWLSVVFGIGYSTSAGAISHNYPANMRPMVFVHGYTGSAQQFEWQAMRFASNGYPRKYLNAFEYDSPNYATTAPAVLAALDARINAILAETGADKVDLLGHSLGTYVAQSYLANPAWAAKVAHYVNLDGRGATSPPGGVPTLALWAEFRFTPGSPIPTIVGAENYILPKHGHNEAATSPEAFALIYKFFTGKEPKSTAVQPERSGRIDLAGRAVLYPQNVGVAGAMLEIYELNPDTGARRHKHPQAVYAIDESGDFGPFKARPGASYEFNLVRPGAQHHFYLEPRIRSDYLIRLNTSPVGGGLGALMTRNPDQTNLVITRNREWLGDQNDGFNDVLAVNGINIVNAANAYSSHMLVAYFVFDWESDHKTNLTPPIPVQALNTTFLSSVDVYLPGTTPPNATIAIAEIPRGTCGAMHRINVPNWASINEDGTLIHSISVQLDDYIEGRCDETWDSHSWPGQGW